MDEMRPDQHTEAVHFNSAGMLDSFRTSSRGGTRCHHACISCMRHSFSTRSAGAEDPHEHVTVNVDTSRLYWIRQRVRRIVVYLV